MEYTGAFGEILQLQSDGRKHLPFQRLLMLIVAVAAVIFLAGCKGDKPTGSPSAPAKAKKQTSKEHHTLELLFTYGSEKQAWIEEVTAQFNSEGRVTGSGKRIRVKAMPMGSGESIEGILSGRIKAHLTSPASAAFIKLGNAESQAKTGKDLVGATQNLVISPVVIAMWKPMAQALGWGKKPVGWSDILELARHPKGWATYGFPQWGTFKFGHTHPKFSNSGLISLFAEVYAGTGKVSGLTVEDVTDPKVGEYLEGIERTVVHYGRSTGFFGRKLFHNGPEYLSAAVLYENMVIESYSPKFDLPFPVVAIYPKEGTFWSDHPAGIVDRDWVTPDHRDAAKMYLDYLLDRPQQEKALKYGFRPADVEIPLASPIDPEHGVDPKEPMTTLEVPHVQVMEAILSVWKARKKHAEVVLVLDSSGSMKSQGKMKQAKEGSLRLLEMLGDDDRFSLLPFNDTIVWAIQGSLLREGRPKALQAIQSLFPSGGTAFYDAVDQAQGYLNDRTTHDRILAVVALTDGLDKNSRMTLDRLLKVIRTEGEAKTVRVFTIAYGSDADKKVLRAISDATQVTSYDGTPENIRKVCLDISTFF